MGEDNILEKDINLDIALKLKEYFEMDDYLVVMTREIDESLYSKTSRNKKRSDLENRVKIANQSNGLITISIHQNSYQTSDCKGAQVFYYEGSKEGEILADYIQNSLVLNLDKDNKRKIKSNNDYYLLKEIKSTSVIVECGFLSNPTEAKLLNDDEYQRKLAYSIFKGAKIYLENHL